MNSNQVHILAIIIVLINTYLLASLISMNFNPIEWYWILQILVLFLVISSFNTKKKKQKS
jgi:hypothetical protein